MQEENFQICLSFSYVLPSDRYTKQQYVAPSTVKCSQAIVVFAFCLFLFAYYNGMSTLKGHSTLFTFLFCKLTQYRDVDLRYFLTKQ
jgi:hypothetical protein